ncbi:CAZyme family GT2 [Penicillium roqueforti]|nr:CAZyme family GT2 [Penicillium roqueforti]KAI2740301.1 CAZyme family GT2 [Penicillium roqueforti]KAI2765823.1 CAZyme family GT2 [Penicillium roqueforti]KAI3207796.1 CAZyme family GT2 [Penicillium roqueforti]
MLITRMGSRYLSIAGLLQWVQRLQFDNIASPELSFYTCPIIFDRNSSETPILVRCADMMWAFAGVSAMYPRSPISIPTSVYTLPLSMAERVGGWNSDGGAIGGDMHMLLKCYFAMDGNITTRVVASPASQCNISSNEHRGWRRNMEWGALDTGFFIRQSAANLSRPSWQILFSGTQWALAHLLFEAHFLPCHLIITLAMSSIYFAFISSESMHPDLEWAFQFTGVLEVCSFIMMNICMIVYGNWHNFCVNTCLTDIMVAVVPDAGFSFRNEWNGGTLLERILFPMAGTLFGPVPAIQAVFSHFWTDRLVYKVSRKPSFRPSSV